MLQHFLGRNDGVHQAEVVGTLGADRISGEGHLQGDAQADPRAEECAAPGREQPALHLGEPELRFGRRDDHVASEQQLETTGQRGAVGGTYERDRDGAFGQTQESSAGVVVTETRLLTGGEGTQVHAGAEGAVAGAGEDDGADVGIGLGVDDRGPDAPDQLRGQRVPRVRAVQARDQDSSASLAHELVGHRASTGSRGGWRSPLPRGTIP